jgi:hypothetical protein
VVGAVIDVAGALVHRRAHARSHAAAERVVAGLLEGTGSRFGAVLLMKTTILDGPVPPRASLSNPPRCVASASTSLFQGP